MPITPYLRGRKFEPDTVVRMSRAFSQICAEQYLDPQGAVAATIAAKMIELAQKGTKSKEVFYIEIMLALKLGNLNPH